MINKSVSTLTDPFCSTSGAWLLCLISALGYEVSNSDMVMRLKYQGGLREKQKICHWQIISTILKTGQATDLRDAFQWRVTVEWDLERGGGAGLFSELLAGCFPHNLVPHTHMANPGHLSRSLSVRGPIPTRHPSIHPQARSFSHSNHPLSLLDPMYSAKLSLDSRMATTLPQLQPYETDGVT